MTDHEKDFIKKLENIYLALDELTKLVGLKLRRGVSFKNITIPGFEDCTGDNKIVLPELKNTKDD